MLLTNKTYSWEYYFTLLVILSISAGEFLSLPLVYFAILLLTVYFLITKKMLVNSLLLLIFLLLFFILQIFASYTHQDLQIEALSYLVHSFPIFITLAFGVLFSNKIDFNQVNMANNLLSKIVYLDWAIWNLLLIIPLEVNFLLYQDTFRFTSLIFAYEAIISLIMLFKIWSNINQNAKWIYYILPILIIFQTFQRAAILSLILIFILSNVKKTFKILGLLLLIVSTITSRAIYMQHDDVNKQLNSVAHRAVLYGYSTLAIHESFPYGVGSGNAEISISNASKSDFNLMVENIPLFTDDFKELIYENDRMQTIAWEEKSKSTSTHNTFLNLILEYGAFGLLYVLIIITPLIFIFFKKPLGMEVKMLYSLMPLYFFLTFFAFIIPLFVLSIRSYRRHVKYSSL